MNMQLADQLNCHTVFLNRFFCDIHNGNDLDLINSNYVSLLLNQLCCPDLRSHYQNQQKNAICSKERRKFNILRLINLQICYCPHNLWNPEIKDSSGWWLMAVIAINAEIGMIIVIVYCCVAILDSVFIRICGEHAALQWSSP